MDFLYSKIDKERFEKNKNYFTALFEKDNKLIFWFAWCLNLVSQEKTYDEVLDYMDKVSNYELSKLIEPLNLKIEDEANPGVIFDSFFGLKSNGRITDLFNIENETSPYSFKEKEARSFYYFCSAIFNEKVIIDEVDKDHYQNIIPYTSLWIFIHNSEKLQNTIDFNNFSTQESKLRFSVNNGILLEEKINTQFKLKSNIFFCYVGNPEQIDLKNMKISGSNQKLSLLLLLCDLIFGFYLDKEKTLLLLENYFNLKGKLITEEVNIMNSLQAFVEPFVKENEDQIIENIAKYLIEQNHNQISMNEALKQAKSIAYYGKDEK